MIIGIAGRTKSGKNTISAWLSRISGHKFRVVSFASALKGLDAMKHGLLSFYPQVSEEVRISLQNLGVKAREEVMGEVWIKLLDVAVGNENVIISDVRFENEVEYVRSKGGFVIYLVRDVDVPEYISFHISEKLNPEVCDYVVDANDIDRAKAEIVEILKERGIDVYPEERAVIYLGGNIAFNNEYVRKFEETRDRLMYDGFFEVINSFDYWFFNEVVYTDKPYRKVCEELVQRDIGDLMEADAGLWVLDYPSIGSAFEIASAGIGGKPTVVVAVKDISLHPWLVALSKVFRSFDEAIEYLKWIFK